MTNPHIIFKSIEGKIKAGVVDLQFLNEKCYTSSCSLDNFNKCTCYSKAIANPIFFKEEKDETIIRKAIKIQEEPNFKQFGWSPELDKPYKIEEEIEVREMSKSKDLNDSFWEDIKLPRHQIDFHKIEIKKFAFIKQPEDVFDTGARLPEQKEQPGFPINGYRSHPKEKEESQDELLHDLLDGIHLTMKDYSKHFERIKSKFTIKRR